ADLESAVGFFLEFLPGFESFDFDEAFEVITLMQTGKLRSFPLVAMGGDFWTHVRRFDLETMVAEGVISPQDLDLIQRADSVEDAIRIIQSRPAPDSRGAAQGGRGRALNTRLFTLRSPLPWRAHFTTPTRRRHRRRLLRPRDVDGFAWLTVRARAPRSGRTLRPPALDRGAHPPGEG